MKVYRISKQQYIEDLSGTGAAIYPGRWNSKGVYILYAAATASLALLESVVHIRRIITTYMLATIDIPEEAHTTLKVEDLPDDWFKSPPADALKKFGDDFISENKFLVLRVPSAIMPEEFNYLINPAHKDFKKVKVYRVKKIAIDNRLV